MNNLGTCYQDGEGTHQDYDKAFYWYKKSAEEGCTIAMFNLAESYRKGEGTQVDLNEAIAWYNKSAEEGNEDAKNALKELGKM